MQCSVGYVYMFNGYVIIRNWLIISMAYAIYVGDSVRRRRRRRVVDTSAS